jgi:hypothetical protein
MFQVMSLFLIPMLSTARINEHKPGVLDELTTERARLLEQESTELEEQANRFAMEIQELGGEEPSRIG